MPTIKNRKKNPLTPTEAKQMFPQGFWPVKVEGDLYLIESGNGIQYWVDYKDEPVKPRRSWFSFLS
jgi:hypothetical protein